MNIINELMFDIELLSHRTAMKAIAQHHFILFLKKKKKKREIRVGSK